ncbi:MAG: esterase-like activity of phytase family protein [Cyclobacteriaceae bacterium]|nr:esterase-like activity of phytase family protein [Cyclobacteriaceae bacterium]
MKRFDAFILLIILALPTTGLTAQPSIGKLNLLDIYVVPHSLVVEGTQVGGLSGIDYDPATKDYYLICDDRSSLQAARYYTAKINIDGSSIDTIVFTRHDLIGKDGKTYPSVKVNATATVDPEGLRYNPVRKEMVWVSEGERIVKGKDTVLVNPGIYVTQQGRYLREIQTPAMMHMTATESGPRQNGTFEALTFTDNFTSLLVALEEPLFQDGPRADVAESFSPVRISKYDVASGRQVAQYAYDLEPVAYAPLLPSAFRVNGVTDILDAGNNKLLVIERSFSTGRLPCTVKVFLADLSSATDVQGLNSLKGEASTKLVSKQLLLNMDELGRHIDNVEGMTWGPTLPNGHRTLMFVADNNFQDFQKTQFLLFEVVP